MELAPIRAVLCQLCKQQQKKEFKYSKARNPPLAQYNDLYTCNEEKAEEKLIRKLFALKI